MQPSVSFSNDLRDALLCKNGAAAGNAGDRNLKRRANVLNIVATLTILQTNLHAILVMLTKPILNSRQKPCAKSRLCEEACRLLGYACSR